MGETYALLSQASSKILAHLVSLLKPYTTSVQPSLPSLHTTLLRLKPLFDFLRRHAARQAHEFQKAYVQTTRWFYETGFRRYVRALEGVRTSKAAISAATNEPIGSVSSSADALGELESLAPASALLSRLTIRANSRSPAQSAENGTFFLVYLASPADTDIGRARECPGRRTAHYRRSHGQRSQPCTSGRCFTVTRQLS